MSASEDARMELMETIQALKSENIRLQEDLDECKAQLFELQHSNNDVADATIQRRCKRLRDSVDTWIANILYEDRSDFTETFRQWVRVESEEGKLESLGLCNRRTLTADMNAGYKRLSWLAKQPCCNCAIISLVIWKFLEKLFEEELPIGTSSSDGTGSDEVDFLNDMFNAIQRENDGERGPESTAHRWRSQTFTAMIATSSFQFRQERKVEALCAALVDELEAWIKLGFTAKKTLVKDILEPAVALHTTIRCSKQSYGLFEGFPPLVHGELEKHPRKWILRDISTWREVSADKDLEPYHYLFPGLYKAKDTMDGIEWTEVLKPGLMVYSTKVSGSDRAETSSTKSLPEQVSSESRSPPQTRSPSKAATAPPLEVSWSSFWGKHIRAKRG